MKNTFLSIDKLGKATRERVRSADIRLPLLLSKKYSYIISLGLPVGDAEFQLGLRGKKNYVSVTKKRGTEVIEEEKDKVAGIINQLKDYRRELGKLPVSSPQTTEEAEIPDSLPKADLKEVLENITAVDHDGMGIQEKVFAIAMAFDYEAPSGFKVEACVQQGIEDPGTIIMLLEKMGVIRKQG